MMPHTDLNQLILMRSDLNHLIERSMRDLQRHVRGRDGGRTRLMAIAAGAAILAHPGREPEEAYELMLRDLKGAS